MKRCPRCKTYKPLEEFGLASSRPDGRNVYCKPCRSIYSAEWRASGTHRESQNAVSGLRHRIERESADIKYVKRLIAKDAQILEKDIPDAYAEFERLVLLNNRAQGLKGRRCR